MDQQNRPDVRKAPAAGTEPTSTAPKSAFARIRGDGVPMPLWLQGCVESIQMLVITVLAAVVPAAAVFFSGGFGGINFVQAARLAGQGWLLVHAVPLDITIVTGASSESAHTGSLHLVPLLFWLIPVLLSWRAGRRIAKASYTDQLWQGLLGALIVHAAFGAFTGLFCSTESVHASPVISAVLPLLPVLIGLLIGARREAGSWGRLIGMNAAEWVATTSQSSRWAGSYVFTAVQAAFVALMATLTLAALLFTVNLAAHWSDVVDVYQGLKPGPLGGAGLTLAQLGYFPNLGIWTMSYSSGAGFSLGTGSSVSPLGTAVPPIPAIPVLAALPVGQLSWGVLTLVIPVIGGVLAGIWFQRAGENHFDDWLSLKSEQRWLTATGSTLVLAVLIGAVSGILAGILAAFSGGSLGFGRLTEVGPNPLTTAGWLAVEVAIGVVIGAACTPWLEHGWGKRREEP